MQKIFLLLIVCSFCGSKTINAQQQKVVIGSPICSNPVIYKNSKGKNITLFPYGDNIFNYLLTEDGIPCCRKNNGYFYAYYKENELIVTDKEVGVTPLNKYHQEKYKTSLLQVQDAVNTQYPKLKSIQTTHSVPSKGDLNILLLLVEFSNKKHQIGKADIDALFNDPGTLEKAGFKEFYEKASHKQLNINVDVVGWYSCNEPYTNFSESKGMYLTGNLVRKAVDEAENDGVDFSKYDNDKDGKVDAIIVMHAGLGADNFGEERYIWPHSWSLSGTVNKAVNYDGVKIDNYVIACETRQYNGVVQAAGIGTFVHEFGHALGLPDLYDGSGRSNGLGHWAIMSAGSWLDNGYRPSNFCAWSRYKLGWEQPIEKNFDNWGQVTLRSMNSHPNQLAKVNTKSDDQYFLVENRQAEMNDIAQPASGLAVYQVSKKMMVKERGVNDNRRYPGIRLLEADFEYNEGLYAAKDRGSANDLFTADHSELKLDANTMPSTKLFDGGSSGVSFAHIKSLDEGVMSFEIVQPDPVLSWYGDMWKESYLNDGSIRNSIRVELEGDEFNFIDDHLPASSYTVSNMPEAYTISAKKISAVQLEFMLEGKAPLHEAENNLDNVAIHFAREAFMTKTLDEVQFPEKENIKIHYFNKEEGARLFVEDFENVVPPALPHGWHAYDGDQGTVNKWKTGVGTNHTTGGAYGMQFFGSNSNKEVFWLISPAIDTKGYESLEFSFWQKYVLNGEAGNKVAVSLDKNTWTEIYNGHPEQSEVWEETIVTLPKSFKGEVIYLGFCIDQEMARGWFWDDVSVKINEDNAIWDLQANQAVVVHYDDVLQQLHFNTVSPVKQVDVINLVGQLLISRKNQMNVSVSALKTGVYIVVVHTGDGRVIAMKFRKLN
ncbi:M6 family metalloprotease domain-containing protein [Saccharicrinis sp. GN24d3]|uniref:M6 family metalloprotease domain-containing protein n=1 Tax=Saccharicrinis sp. GN24d3 TaxID=3458416 RepID=UPI004036A771